MERQPGLLDEIGLALEVVLYALALAKDVIRDPIASAVQQSLPPGTDELSAATERPTTVTSDPLIRHE